MRIAAFLLLVALAGCARGPRIISSFGATHGPEGYPRVDGMHTGIDIAAVVGTPLIAPADGYLTSSSAHVASSCGVSITISHSDGFNTHYCHLSSVAVESGPVRRGDLIGYTGNTGRRAGLGYEHVHFEVRRNWRLEDPEKYIVGCFDPKHTYPTDKLVLTYPVKC